MYHFYNAHVSYTTYKICIGGGAVWDGWAQDLAGWMARTASARSPPRPPRTAPARRGRWRHIGQLPQFAEEEEEEVKRNANQFSSSMYVFPIFFLYCVCTRVEYDDEEDHRDYYNYDYYYYCILHYTTYTTYNILPYTYIPLLKIIL